MEFRLNKIDTDLRQKINDAAKEGYVHGAKNIAINKDKAKESKDNNNKSRQDNNSNNTKLLVDAVKTENVEIEAFKERNKTYSNSIGVYLDTKK